MLPTVTTGRLGGASCAAIAGPVVGWSSHTEPPDSAISASPAATSCGSEKVQRRRARSALRSMARTSPLLAPIRAAIPGQSYAAAVSDLERVLEQNRGRLDTSTVRVLERNLATIDSAIAQAQRALAADSANVYLNSHLAETRQRKLELLRQAAALVSSVS